MKTPYDTALRLRRRELDEVGAAIRDHTGAIDEVNRMREQVRSAMAQEAELAAAEGTMCSQAWLRRMRGKGAELGAAEARLEVQLGELRDTARDAYGMLRGIETAAEDYRSEAARVQANAEQAIIDDLGAVAFIKAQRLVRRGGAQ